MQYLLDFHFDWCAKTFNRIKEDKIILIVLRRMICSFPPLQRNVLLQTPKLRTNLEWSLEIKPSNFCLGTKKPPLRLEMSCSFTSRLIERSLRL